MAKKRTRAEELQENLQKDFQRWEYLNTHGGSDPLYEDGFNMNIVRNHIIYDKRKCQEELEEKDYPKEYFRETPPQVDNYYMARMDEIRENAKSSLLVYKADSWKAERKAKRAVPYRCGHGIYYRVAELYQWKRLCRNEAARTPGKIPGQL